MNWSLTDHASLTAQATALLSGHTGRIANSANLAALVYMNLKAVNWVGFYFLCEGELVLGPFQGKPACVSIPLGRGVCGTAAVSRAIQRVDDVRTFEGHIACDVDSRSELVIPLVKAGELIGVFDLDSPEPGRFGDRDEALLVDLAKIYVDSID